jgi:hypothetical protein
MDLDALIALNIIIYASLVFGLVVWRRGSAPVPTDTKALYKLLEATLGKAFPELPEGFTWREALRRAKKERRELGMKWESIDKSIRNYEAYRYGNAPLPDEAHPELLELIRALGGPG